MIGYEVYNRLRCMIRITRAPLLSPASNQLFLPRVGIHDFFSFLDTRNKRHYEHAIPVYRILAKVRVHAALFSRRDV